jgi:3D (Asp-Asp-Asp) domain-containing protein
MATAYTSAVEECDETPHLTATNRLVRKGIVALSRDLLREFTPGAPFSFGDHVEIAGVGRFVVEDTMNPRYTGRVDIWCSTREEALAWGARRVQLKPVAAKDGRKRRDAAVPSVAIPALVSEVQQETIVPVVVPPLAPHDTVTEPAAAAS